jgi:hypothetical protein
MSFDEEQTLLAPFIQRQKKEVYVTLLLLEYAGRKKDVPSNGATPT